MHGNWYRCYVGQRFHHEVSGLRSLRGIDNANAAPYELLVMKSYMSHLLIDTTKVCQPLFLPATGQSWRMGIVAGAHTMEPVDAMEECRFCLIVHKRTACLLDHIDRNNSAL